MNRPAESCYVDTFFRELSPVWLNHVAALHGIGGCDLHNPFAYMELGCGFGHSSIVNAAAFPHAEFHACDFNAEHIAAACARATAWGLSNLHLHECSFDHLPVAELPRFDFIVLHGVYSWVTEPVRASVRAFIDRQLKPGGLVYLSYNCLPDWSIELPLQRLLSELAAEEPGDANRRAGRAASRLHALSNSNFAYFNLHPLARGVADSYVSKPPEYLVHEFLSQSCEAFYSIDVAGQMASLGLQYVGSATLADNHAALVMNETAAAATSALSSRRQQQLAEDFAVNRAFRRDVFFRTPNAAATQNARPLHSLIVGCVDPERLASRIRVPQGVLRLQDSFVEATQALMREGSIALSDAVIALAGAGHDRGEVARNVLYLLAAGVLEPFARVHRGSVPSDPPRPSNEVIERALAYSVARQSACVLPSPAMGNGVELEPCDALAIRTLFAGAGNIDALSSALQIPLQQLGYRLDPRAVAQRAMHKVLPQLTRAGLVAW